MNNQILEQEKIEQNGVEQDDDMLPEYDFTNGVRGKHYNPINKDRLVNIQEADGSVSVHYYTLEDGAILLDPDVRRYFPDSASVNQTLRSLISLIPKERREPELD